MASRGRAPQDKPEAGEQRPAGEGPHRPLLHLRPGKGLLRGQPHSRATALRRHWARRRFLFPDGRCRQGDKLRAQRSPPCSPLTCCSCKRNRWKSCRWTAEASGRSVLLPSGKEMVFRRGRSAVGKRSQPAATRAPSRAPHCCPTGSGVGWPMGRQRSLR